MAAVALAACDGRNPRTDEAGSAGSCELVVATYDSLASKDGWGSGLVSRFNEAHPDCPARLVAGGDGVQILNRVALEKSRGKRLTHVVLGVDQFLWDRLAADVDTWDDWRPEGWQALPESLRQKPGFLAFDWAPFALVADRSRLPAGMAPPRTLRELASPKWKGKLLAQDPRTSTPGQGLIESVARAAGDDSRFEAFWLALRPSILTLMPGWDQAYGAFLQGEAPLVWSYLTSQAYHRMHGDREGRFVATVPKDGEVIQVEGAAILRDAASSPRLRGTARAFLQFVISKSAQEAIPERQWMFPVRTDVPLAAAFRELGFDAKKEREIPFPSAESQRGRLARWERATRAGGP